MLLNKTVKELLGVLAEGDLSTAWSHASCSSQEFADAVTALTGQTVRVCDDCDDPEWEEDLNRISVAYNHDREVCESCLDNYTVCDKCGDRADSDNTTYVSGEDYCESCLGAYCTYCEQCDEYFLDSDEHTHNCDCVAPHRDFRFPANGDGTVAQDEPLVVKMPGGVIDGVGVTEIQTLIWKALSDNGQKISPVASWDLRNILESVGEQWQTKTGNFTKRVSKALAENGVKLPKDVVSAIGNMARAHSSETSEWNVEFTRNLNLSAEDFFHEDSCWWGGNSESRCALKNWGGLGLRSFNHRGRVTGRAWIQPLNSDLQPTHNVEEAFAYVVYNGYGEFEGFKPARIVAHLTGRSYRKIGLSLNPQYVNNDSGYLVADQATCDATESIYHSFNEHDKLDAQHLSLMKEMVA